MTQYDERVETIIMPSKRFENFLNLNVKIYARIKAIGIVTNATKRPINNDLKIRNKYKSSSNKIK